MGSQNSQTLLRVSIARVFAGLIILMLIFGGLLTGCTATQDTSVELSQVYTKEAAQIAANSRQCYEVRSKKAYIRADHSRSSKEVGRVPPPKRLEGVKANQQDWYQITKPVNGWILKSTVDLVNC